MTRMAQSDATYLTKQQLIQAEFLRDKYFDQVKALRAELEAARAVLDAAQGNSLRDVLTERARQDAKWGEQNHDPFTYGMILMEEVGEFSQAALHSRFGDAQTHSAHLREEAVHVAAVALAIIECLDRDKWKWIDVALPANG